MLNPCDKNFIERVSLIGLSKVLRRSTPADLEEPRGRWHGVGQFVACPSTAAELSEIVRLCFEGRVGIVPRGGATGLVGGQVMTKGVEPLIVSLERMNTLRGIYRDEDVLVVDAGVTLAFAQGEAEKVNRLFPLSLASEGSATIGGVLATNAGGVNVLRYGNARDLCLGVEAVLPNAQIYNGLKRLRKDNTGYDLRHLLIGSEGTLGIITAASLRLVARPASVVVALLAVPCAQKALELLEFISERFNGMMSAFELINRMGYEFLRETMPDLNIPLNPLPPWSVLLELSFPSFIQADEVMASLYEEAYERSLVSDGVIAHSVAQARGLWRIRETIPEANRKIGAISSHDISLPLSMVPEFIKTAYQAVLRHGNWRVNCFGHLGDGNLHYNVFPPAGHHANEYADQREQITTLIHDIAHGLGGSISAEHGIGRLKVGDLQKYGDTAKLDAMRAIKQALDPKGIMNPGAILHSSAV